MTYLDTFLDPFQTLFRPFLDPFRASLGLVWIKQGSIDGPIFGPKQGPILGPCFGPRIGWFIFYKPSNTSNAHSPEAWYDMTTDNPLITCNPKVIPSSTPQLPITLRLLYVAYVDPILNIWEDTSIMNHILAVPRSIPSSLSGSYQSTGIEYLWNGLLPQV